MRLFNYLNEKIEQHWEHINKKLTKYYNISDKDIEMAKKELAKKNNIKESFLKFVFISEMLKDKIVFISFNVEDENHKMYKSTINYRWLPMEKRGA